jgi:hypothetical protein
LKSKKKLFTADYEMHASARLLFPYIHSASELSEWFAANVNISPEKIFTFQWENENKRARLKAFKPNHYTRFEFIPENPEDEKDPAYFELRLETDELTQLTYLKVSDYSDFDDQEELQDLWDGLVDNLKTVVGG